MGWGRIVYMNDIKIEVDPIFNDKYVCDITRDLDQMSNLNTSGDDLFHHYIQYDHIDLCNNMVAIRVPGGTLGYIKYDSDFIIIEISIDTNYVVKTYFRNVNKAINRKYVGSKLILWEMEKKE